jgi:hypothetical protein
MAAAALTAAYHKLQALHRLQQHWQLAVLHWHSLLELLLQHLLLHLLLLRLLGRTRSTGAKVGGDDFQQQAVLYCYWPGTARLSSH